MGYELVTAPDTDAEATVSLATTLGWSDLAGWMATLPQHDYPRLYTLAEKGWSDDAEALAEELDEAIDAYTPDADDVLSTATDLLVSLTDRGPVPVYVTG